MKMWTEAKGEEEGIGFIQVGVILPSSQTGLGHASCQFQLRKKATTP